jgi:transcription antitermination factor NusG
LFLEITSDRSIIRAPKQTGWEEATAGVPVPGGNLETPEQCRRLQDPIAGIVAQGFGLSVNNMRLRIDFMSIPREADRNLERPTSSLILPEASLVSEGAVVLEESWFALYVQVNHEREVTKRLEQKEVNAFLPLVERWSKRRDRRKKVSVPLFPGYLFIRAVLDNPTHVHILKTPGALTLIGNSGGPVAIPPYQIENLQTMLQSPHPIQLNPYLKEGDWVHVIRGPLAGCMGILLRQNPKKGRLIVSVDIICRSVSVELDTEDVEPIAPPAG